jgi:hypothetical protein
MDIQLYHMPFGKTVLRYWHLNHHSAAWKKFNWRSRYKTCLLVTRQYRNVHLRTLIWDSGWAPLRRPEQSGCPALRELWLARLAMASLRHRLSAGLWGQNALSPVSGVPVSAVRNFTWVTSQHYTTEIWGSLSASSGMQVFWDVRYHCWVIP